MFTSLRANPFLKWELRRTSTSSAKINWSFIWLRVIPLTLLTLVALIPVFYYIDDNGIKFLPLMAIILYIPRCILALKSIAMGIAAMRQDIIQQRWEVLILTGISAKRIVRRKWINIVAQTLPDQILFSLPAIGLALGISQFFQTSSYCGGVGQAPPTWSIRYILIHTWLQPYCYVSEHAYFAGHLNPSMSVILIGITLIIVTAFMEAGLNASIGLLAGFSKIAGKGIGIIYGTAIHLGLALIILLSIAPLGNRLIYNILCPNFVLIDVFFCPNYYGRRPSVTYDPNIFYDMHKVINRGYDTIQLATMILFDQGTLLAANVMRPNDDRLLKIYFIPYDAPVLHYSTPVKYQTSHILFINNSYDNRPFVLRNVIAAVISAFFYFLLIRYFLRRATRFAIVNHGASGYLEL